MQSRHRRQMVMPPPPAMGFPMSPLSKRSNRVMGKCCLSAGVGFAVALSLERFSGGTLPSETPSGSLPPCFLLAGAFAILSMVGAHFRHPDHDR